LPPFSLKYATAAATKSQKREYISQITISAASKKTFFQKQHVFIPDLMAVASTSPFQN